MPRDIAPALTDQLLDNFPTGSAYPPNVIKRRPMPHPVVYYLKHRLRAVIQQEQDRLISVRSKWADHTHPEVQQAEVSYHQSVARHAQFPAAEWEEELRSAVARTTAFLIRPVRTAIRFIYEQEEPSSVPPEHVLERLAHFSAYGYLQEAVRAYVSQRDIDTVDRTRLATLLTRVDQQMTADYSADQWLRLLEPLFEMSRSAYGRATVPAHQLQEFFDEKSQKGIARRVASKDGMITHDAMHSLLKEAAAGQEAELQEAESPDRASREQTRASEDTARAELEPPSPIEDGDEDEPVPLWKRFHQASAPSVAKAVEGKRQSTEQDRPRWERFQPDPEPDAASVPLDKLESDVMGKRGEPNRNRFIRHLFNGSEQEYRVVLARLRKAKSWNEASKVIASDVFRKNQVNIYSDPAVSFTNAVEARFRE